MKYSSLSAILILLVSLYSFSQRSVRIGYVDMDYILENVEEYQEATSQLDVKVQKWKQELESQQSAIAELKKDLQAEKALLTNALIAEREEEIQLLETEMLAYQYNRFGPQGDLIIQKQRLIQPIQDQVFNEVQKIGQNKKYDFILDKSADVVMLYSEKRHDISDLILREIGRTRKIKAFKQKEKDSKQASEEPEVINEALQERQEKATAAREEKIEALETRRAELLRLREERRKEYEARKEAIWQEREAKRKAKLEAREKIKQQQNDTINENTQK